MDGHFRLGVACMQSGRYDDAAGAFTSALACDAFHLPSSLRLAWCLQRRGARADAIQEFKKAVVIDETNALAHALLGTALVLDEPAAAVESLAKAQALGLSIPELHVNLVAAHVRAGRSADARAALVQAARNDAGALAYVNQGCLQAQDGMLAEARASFERAVSMDASCVEARNNLACSLDAAKKSDSALDEFQRALELSPGNATVLANQAVALRAKGRTAEADHALAAAAASNGDSVAAVVNQALALRQQGKLEAAVELLQRAVNLLAPKRVEAKVDLAICLLELRKSSDALSELTAAAQLKPDDADIHLLIGCVQHAKNALPEAVRAYQRAGDLDKQNWMAHNNLAIALLKKSDPSSWQACQAEFRLAMRSNEANEHIGRGFSYLSAGSLHEARAEWSKVPVMRPEPRPIREFMLGIADVLSAADARGIS